MIENIYYMVFSVLPTKQNQAYDNIESATVYCWIKSTDVQSSYITATFFIEKADWIIQENIQKLIVVTENNFIDNEKLLECFHIAQKEKMFFQYIAESDNVTEPTKVKLQSSYKFDMSNFLQKLEDISKEGRCLHYQSNHRCNEIINAHSIQNNGVLSKIANKKNEIYALSRNMGDFKKNDGNIGWSFIFSWHKSSDSSCLPFIQSLKDRMKQGDNLGTILFKFILLNIENFAFSPTWWESISINKQKEISQAVSNMMQPTLAIRQHYLYNGLENISNLDFETINDNLTTVSKQ
ncbi:MAG: hypothetical protein U9Q04_05955 [Campylobacterota bacterium]|nr:hypothetical protein [Campylobacterota bacterium]